MKSKGQKDERSFPFLRLNERESKPRKRGLTEIRGPYYSAYGRRHLEDLFETMGRYIDSLKFAGGSFTLMPKGVVREMIDLCHKYGVLARDRKNAAYRGCVREKRRVVAMRAGSTIPAT